MHKTIDIKLEETRNGEHTVKVNGYYLHSKYNPINEAEKFVQKHYKPNHIHILFGTGLGYFAEKFKNTFTNGELLVCVEPIKELKVADYCYDVLIQNYSNKDLKNILSELISVEKNVTVICSPNYDKLFQEEYLDFLEQVKEIVNLKKIEENTIKRFAKEWFVNYLNNISDISRDYDIQDLNKKFNYPIVIASGGPSLIKQIPLLKQYKKNFILISSGSTINTLLHYDVEPDFVVSIDGGEENYRHFKERNFKNAKLVYSLFNYHEIKKCFKNEVFHFLTQDSVPGILTHYYSIFNKEPVHLLGGGSVALYALTFGRYISDSPIAIIGQDLAFTDNKSHAEFNKNFVSITDEEAKSRNMFYINGYYDEKVLTDYTLFSMKNSFEKLINQLEKNEIIYNCTEGGAKIEGFNQLPFKDFCEKYTTSDVQISNLSIQKFKINKEAIISTLNSDIKIYKEIIKLANENLSLLNRTKNIKRFPEKINNSIDRNDKKINLLVNTSPISMIIQQFAIEVLKNYSPQKNETQKEMYNRIFQSNSFLYNKIKKAATDAIDLTNELINKNLE